MKQWIRQKENCEELLRTREAFISEIDAVLAGTDLMRMEKNGRYLAYVTDINNLLTQRESIEVNLSVV